VTLLCNSLPRFPRVGSFAAKNCAIRTACFSIRRSCSCTLSGSAVLAVSPSWSALVCSVSKVLTFCSNCSFFCRKSANVPLPSFAALEDSLRPSKAKWVPPNNPCSSHTSRISRKRETIASCMDEIKPAIVRWSGTIPHASAMNVIFSRQACSIFREEMMPREYAKSTTFSNTLGSYAGLPAVSFR
jgi:hypothetical protein